MHYKSIQIVEEKSFLIVRNELVEVGFSRRTGQLAYVADPVSGACVMGSRSRGARHSTELHEGGCLIPLAPHQPHFYTDQPQQVRKWGGDTRYLGHDYVCLPVGVTLNVSFGDKRWQVEQQVTVSPRSPVVKLSWKISYLGEQETKLRRLVFRLGVHGGSRGLVSLPGASAVPDCTLGELPAQTYFKYGAFVRNRSDTLVFGAWSHDPHFMALNLCERQAGTVRLSFEHAAAGSFQHGMSMAFGSNYLHVTHGSLHQAIETYRRHYEENGLSLDRGIAPAAHQAAIWEGFVGKILFDPDFSYEGYPTLQDFQRDLPRIAGLGFDTIQLMPQMPFPWYTVYHHESLHGTYGGDSEDDVKDFILTAKACGLKVILDIVVHGVADGESSRKGLERYACRNRLFQAGLEQAEPVNSYRQRHPEWFRYDENGDFHYLHTWDLDFEDPGLRQEFISHLTRCAEEFHCDGFRIDAPYWGCEPNWNPDYPLWAGASFTRNVAMLREAERTLRPRFPKLIWYTEHEHPEWRAFMDMTYAYEESWLLWRPEPKRQLPIYQGDITAQKMALWFDLRRRVLPRRDIVLQHHIDSHDSWWNEAESAFGRDKFGAAPARLMTAFCLMLDGAFLAFCGAERGSEEWIRRLLTLRRELVPLAQGRCDYVKCQTGHPSVMALYHESETSFCVSLFNFSMDCSQALVCIQGRIPQITGRLIDAVTGKTVAASFDSSCFRAGMAVSMTPNALLILMVEPETT